MIEKINSYCKKLQFLSGATLKYIAMISMLLDHLNKGLIYPHLVSSTGFLATFSNLCDILGRIAFPIFCFMLVEGFFKTKNRTKYLLYLLLFAVISEVPFDMSTTASIMNGNWQNVMFTLALVLVTIWIIDTLKYKMMKKPKWLWYLVSILIVLVMSAISMSFSLDYEEYAILIGYFFYLFYDKLFLAIPCGALVLYTQPWSLLGFGLLLTYNGERGKQSKILNYFFYPAHLLLIGLLRWILSV